MYAKVPGAAAALLILPWLRLVSAADARGGESCADKRGVGQDNSSEDVNLIQKELKHGDQRSLQASRADHRISNSFSVSSEAQNADHYQSNSFSSLGSDPVVGNVLTAFNAMATNGAAINIDTAGQMPKGHYNNYIPPYTEHIEGIQRFRPSSTGGSSFIAMTGATTDFGNIFIAEMPSRAAGPGPLTTGGGALAGTLSKVLQVGDSTYSHSGGFQINGDLLAVGMEKGCNAMARMIPAGFFGACEKKSQVWFYDVSDPQNPQKLSSVIDRPTNSAGAVGILKQQSGNWIAIVGDGNNVDLDLYVQQANGSFTQAASWTKTELLKSAGVSGGYKSYQTNNFILQADGVIHMVCTTRDPMMIGHDYFDLFTVAASGGGRAQITMVASKAVTSHGQDFSSAAGIYVDSSSSILGYGAPWLPASTPSNPVIAGNTIYVNEFR